MSQPSSASAVGVLRRRTFWSCFAVGVASITLPLVIGAVILRPPGIWVVLTVVQIPIGAAIGVLTWLVWLIAERFMARRQARNGRTPARSRGTVTAAISAAGQTLFLVVYWADSPSTIAIILHGVTLPIAAAATFTLLARAAPSSEGRASV